MPSVSHAQNAAMHAAAAGHSTLGIPKTVGEEFVKADAGTKVGGLPKVAAPSSGLQRLRGVLHAMRVPKEKLP